MISDKGFRPFGMRDKIGYLFGDFGNDFTFVFSTSILMKFYTDAIGVSPAVVGIIMMAARFADGFTDVAMGRICDNSKVTAAGKFKPWILRMCVPVAIASFLMYQSNLAYASMIVKIIWLAITYILWGSVFYTSINIPYGSMASAISYDSGDRQSLSTFRTIGGMLAGMIIGIGVPLFAYERIGEKEVLVGSKVTLIAGVFSVLAIICYLLCYKLVTERVHTQVPQDTIKKNSVRKMLINAVKNRALLSIIVSSILMLLAQLTMQSMANYIYPDYYGSKEAQSLSTLLMMAGMLIAAIVAKPLVKKFGKAEVSVVSSFFAGIVSILLFFIRPENVWVFVIFQMFCWLGLGMFAMVNWSLITDVIDYSELKNGIREDGSVYAIYSFARKLGQAVAAGLSGVLLEIIGYSGVAATTEKTQSEYVLDGIFNISTLIPGIGFILLAIVLWFWYPLHKKQVDANIMALKEKHKSETEGDYK